tara:strand:+ start:179 stop:472 length:294 start_codon:yes stop_codon:yes gene_type:complete
MDRNKIRNSAKEKIDQIFQSLDEIERSGKSFTDKQKEIWKRDLNNLEKSKETIQSLYDNLLEDTQESFDHIKSAFDQMSDVMNQRLTKIKQEYKKTA